MVYIDCSLLCSGHWGGKDSSSRSFQPQAVRGTNKPGVRRGFKGGRFCIWLTREGFLEEVAFEEGLREQRAEYSRYV